MTELTPIEKKIIDYLSLTMNAPVPSSPYHNEGKEEVYKKLRNFIDLHPNFKERIASEVSSKRMKELEKITIYKWLEDLELK